MSIAVRQATIHDLENIAPLFDAYRQFYGQAADRAMALHFLRERFAHHESVVLLATNDEGEGIGFVQLYPMFSSVRAARIYVLNDLFVTPAARRHGVATALMREAEAFARAVGACGITLSTAHDNRSAQALYESLGWKRELDFRDYHLAF